MLPRRSATGDPASPAAVSAGARDAQLMEAIRRRDLRAFEELYRVYHPRLTRFLLNIIRRPHLVEEALNDTLLVVWEKPESFNGSSRVSTWIFGIAYRKALKTVRRWDEPMEDAMLDYVASDDIGADEAMENREVSQGLHVAMDGLSAEHRAVVNLAYFQEIGYREIAEIMDCPVDTVKTRMFHARRRLKTLLAGQPADWL